jgi:hypothetical protein
MTEPTERETADRLPRTELQFGIQALLGMFVLVAVLMSYLRPLGVPVVVKFSVIVAIAMVCGGLIGLVGRKFSDAVFWSAIGSTCGYLAVVNAFLMHWSDEYLWPMVGGIVGATAAALGGRKLAYRVGLCSILGLGMVSAVEFPLFGFTRDLVGVFICAVGGSALLVLVVDLASRFEKWTSIPRHFMAIGLVIAAVAGHWIVLRFVPGLR